MKAKTPVSDDIRRQIALRAYYIWEREGHPDGRQQAHWALAEAEILSERPVKQAAASLPVAKKSAAAKKPAAKKVTNGAAKSAKPEPVKPDAPVKAVAAANAVKAKKVTKTKKMAPPKG